jgi:hypothetical protein
MWRPSISKTLEHPGLVDVSRQPELRSVRLTCVRHANLASKPSEARQNFLLACSRADCSLPERGFAVAENADVKVC